MTCIRRGMRSPRRLGSCPPAVRIGQDAVWHTLEVCMDYCVAQGLTSRKFTKEEVFAPVV